MTWKQSVFHLHLLHSCGTLNCFLENNCKTFWYLVDSLHYLSPAISDSIAPLLTLHEFALYPQSEHFAFIQYTLWGIVYAQAVASIVCMTCVNLLCHINCYRVEIQGVNKVVHVLQLSEV